MFKKITFKKYLNLVFCYIRMVYRLVALDQGGLLTTTGEVPSSKVFERLGISEAYGLEIWKNYDVDFFSGRMSENEWWQKFIDVAKRQISIDDAKRIFRENFQPYTDNLIFAKKIKDSGIYKVVIWSNNSKEWLDFQQKKFHVGEYVHALISSHEIGITKYSPEFFEYALKETQRRLNEIFLPNEVLFADDVERYVNNAKKKGLSAVHVPKPELFQDKLLAAGIRI